MNRSTVEILAAWGVAIALIASLGFHYLPAKGTSPLAGVTQLNAPHLNAATPQPPGRGPDTDLPLRERAYGSELIIDQADILPADADNAMTGPGAAPVPLQ